MKTKKSNKDQERKDTVLRTYALTGYNLMRTSRETGVSRKTIKTWAEQRGVAQLKEVSDAIKSNPLDKVEDIKTRVERKSLQLKETILEKMNEMIPSMKLSKQDIDVLGRVYKSLEPTQSSSDGGESGNVKGDITFLEMVTQQIKFKKYGNKAD